MKVEVFEEELDPDIRPHVPREVQASLRTIQVTLDPARVVMKFAGTTGAGEAIDLSPRQLLETQWVITALGLEEGYIELTMAAGTHKKIYRPDR